ncbi:hypothetical protein [Clostridium algidicarnis]|uniref:hypothetical protein n=1 Tax=Clostridium algidicarnis TaxID=37659 RepID=UPI003FD6CB5F
MFTIIEYAFVIIVTAFVAGNRLATVIAKHGITLSIVFTEALVDPTPRFEIKLRNKSYACFKLCPGLI